MTGPNGERIWWPSPVGRRVAHASAGAEPSSVERDIRRVLDDHGVPYDRRAAEILGLARAIDERRTA